MSTHSKRGFLARIWFGFWRLLDGFRRAVLNIVFLLLLVFIIMLFTQGERIKPLETNTTLVIQPVGVVVDEFSGSAVDRALSEALGNEVPETRLRDLLAVLEFAKDDADISQLLIDVRKLNGIGLASLSELETALNDFKESGKPVYAFSDFMEQRRYHLASNADQVFLENGGMLWLDGFAAYRNYFAEGLEKLKVDINLFRVGEYKSAMEPFIRTDMSEASKRANSYLLNGLWQDYLEDIAQHRGIPVGVLQESIQRFPALQRAQGGDTAKTALEAGLVDELVSRPELRARLSQAETGALDDEGELRQIDHRSYLSRKQKLNPTLGDKIAVVVAQGTIIDGDAPNGTVGGDTVAMQIRKARMDNSVKAVVLRVNSPGGSASASEVIRQELLATQQIGKPVIVSMGDLAASGGYWISMASDEVWANNETITGSIGIFGMIPTFQDSFKELGIHTDGVGTIDRAGGLRADRELHPEIESLIQGMIENGYQRFLMLVAESRQMSVDEVDLVAQGRVWTGAQAQSRSLVDQIGGLQSAIQSAAKYADLGDDYQVVYVQQELSPLEQMIMSFSAKVITSLDIAGSGEKLSLGVLGNNGLGAILHNPLYKAVQPFLQQNNSKPVVQAHCLCNAP